MIDEPIRFSEVLADEDNSIQAARRHSGIPDIGGPGSKPLESKWGLALSGGGIRSATFNLGVLEALCQRRLLSRFDYLSTVSGGGFIGGWVTSQVHHRFRGDIAAFEGAFATRGGELDGSVKHLLRNRNYLFGPDANVYAEAWKRAVLYVGGVASNLFLFVVAVLALLSTTRVVVEAARLASWDVPDDRDVVWLVPLALVATAVVMPLGPVAHTSAVGARWTRVFYVLAAVVAAVTGVVAVVAGMGFPKQLPDWQAAFVASAVAYACFFGLALIAAELFSGRWRETYTGGSLLAMIWRLIGTVFPSLVLGGLMVACAFLLQQFPARDRYATAVIGAGFAILSMTLTTMFQLQVAGASFSGPARDQLEELAPRLALCSLAWLAVAGTAIYGTKVVLLLDPEGATWQFAKLVGVLVVCLAFAVAFMLRAPRLSIGFVVVAVLVVGCAASYGIRALLGTMDYPYGFIEHILDDWLTPPSLTATTIVAIGMVLMFSALVILFDVNSSALLRHYRAALERAFLTPPIEAGGQTWPELPINKISHAQRPFHLVNATANAWGLFAGTSAFTFSPLFCGLRQVGTEGSYRSTAKFMGGGLSLATTLAISGAAVSPNTTGFGGARGFVLGLANARLGQWVANPGHSSSSRNLSPRLGGMYWFRELFGRKQENAPYLYVTDGGHFENLGIYELVARRCRVIVSIDAGADPKFAFEDLANAVRRCATDFSVDIHIDCDQVTPGGGGRVHEAWTLGRIEYPDGPDGLLLYIKAALSVGEPIDVVSYAAQHPYFPHESTTEQFFDEAQFESYRRLGHYIGTRTLSNERVRKLLALD